MNKVNSLLKPMLLIMALVLTTFMSGCGNRNSDIVEDTVAPTVLYTSPIASSVGNAINVKIIATFSEDMTSSTIIGANFTLVNTTLGGSAVAGSVAYDSATRTLVFTPTTTLPISTLLTATIATGVQDLAGNAMAAASTWSFTTGTTADTTAPTVSSTMPADAATGTSLNANVTATSSEAMDPATISTSTFTLVRGATPVSGVVTYLGTTATFNPDASLLASTLYTATLTTVAKDLAGNALASNHVWTFTTGTALAAGPAPVVLGTAGNYAILAETLISATGTAGTAVTGHIAVSPAAATFIQGFSLILDGAGTPPACFSTTTLVTGQVYAADYNTGGCPTPANLTTAIGDMMIAYTDAAGRTLPDQTELGAGNISGMTLTPGLYKWGTGVLINTDVTLNGGSNDVWIFQIAGDLTIANATSILLNGGALPKNIFWQVGGGTGVAIGTTAHFEGVILAAKAITLNTGASGNGRLLAQTAVTLDGNAVTQPAP